jgi:hypothetical protein
MARTTTDIGAGFLKSHMTEAQKGPDLRPRANIYTPSEIKDRIDNESANYRRGIGSDDNY